MRDGVAVVRDGHRTMLKWHRGRKAIGDLPFTGERILEGMRLGASVEVDLVKHADGGFAVLHDFSLEHDTTGSGPVKDAPAAVLRELHLRGSDGRPTAHRLMLFEDLCALIAAGEGISPEAILQLDLKEEAAGALGPREIAAFAASVAPVARHFILSGGSAANVALLADPVPGLAVGYDPCHEGAIDRLLASRDFTGFVAGALAAAPRATMIYLEHRLVLFAAELGFDLVAAFHAAGKTIDAYTLKQATPETAALAERLLALRVDQITTDDPAALEELLEG
jgi:glycerophosphoryl diester phosphodiesterase